MFVGSASHIPKQGERCIAVAQIMSREKANHCWRHNSHRRLSMAARIAVSCSCNGTVFGSFHGGALRDDSDWRQREPKMAAASEIDGGKTKWWRVSFGFLHFSCGRIFFFLLVAPERKMCKLGFWVYILWHPIVSQFTIQ